MGAAMWGDLDNKIKSKSDFSTNTSDTSFTTEAPWSDSTP